MTDTPADVVESVRPPRRAPGRWRRTAVVLTVMLLLFGVPWWTLLAVGHRLADRRRRDGHTRCSRSRSPALPTLMMLGHGRRHRDGAAVAGDALLGAAWVLFVWSVLGQMLRRGAARRRRRGSGAVAGGRRRGRGRRRSCFWCGVTPRRCGSRGCGDVDVGIDRLGHGLDGLRVAVITDTHYGPDRPRPVVGATWSTRVNELGADVVCHVGDIADGTVAVREEQASPLAAVTATSARVYVTGNHEYFSEAQGWLDYMESIGWDALHNRHVVVERGGDRLVVAGVDDATAQGIRCPRPRRESRTPRSRAPTATLPVLLLAHQPKQVPHAVRAGVDLQVSGSHPRRPDLAVQLPRPTRPTGGAGAEPAR